MTVEPLRQRRYPPFTRKLLLGGLAIAVAPIVALVAALVSSNLLFLDYVHVLTGGTWTGFDIFMGAVMTRVMTNLDPPSRVEVAKRLTPANVFIPPSLASVAVTSGYYLANKLGVFNLSSPLIIAAGIVVLILVGQGFGIFLPNSVRVFIELAKPQPDTGRIVKLNMRNLRLAGVQATLQVILILIMAMLAF